MTARIIVDCRGMACPHPVLKTKSELDRPNSDPLQVIVDNHAAQENVTMLAHNAGHSVSVEEIEGLFQINIDRAGTEQVTDPDKQPAPSEAAGPPPVSNTVYLITTNLLGQGSPDLGQVLMKSLFVTLVEQNPAPAAVLLLNTGVQLAVEGSPVLEHLLTLSAKGTGVLVCGTCLDYYRLREKLAVGNVSNMYDIHGRLDQSAKVITVA